MGLTGERAPRTRRVAAGRGRAWAQEDTWEDDPVSNAAYGVPGSTRARGRGSPFAPAEEYSDITGARGVLRHPPACAYVSYD